MALGGFHPAPVGTPEMVADVFQKWIEEADVDGFNIAYVTSPGSFEDVVYLLRPELVKRGLTWEDYDVPGGTLRENLYGVKGQKYLRNDHYGHNFVYPSEFRGDNVVVSNGEQDLVNGEQNRAPMKASKAGPINVDEKSVLPKAV